MGTTSRVKTESEKIAEAERILAKDHSEAITRARVVRKAPYPNPPTSVRLSLPLLARLDRLAAEQHRTRGNLIQHILWDYVIHGDSSRAADSD